MDLTGSGMSARVGSGEDGFWGVGGCYPPARADVLDAHRSQLAGLDTGKGCIRYRSPAAVDFTVVHLMLTAVAASRGPVC
jgi:hypothetical protein